MHTGNFWSRPDACASMRPPKSGLLTAVARNAVPAPCDDETERGIRSNMAIDSRDELSFALTQAASVEHSLACQYLFAAYSLKRDTSDGLNYHQANLVGNWQRYLLMVARQEMEHLGLVCNLLAAIGAAPYLGHPNFPYPTPMFSHIMQLERFSEAALKRFICFERPDEISPTDAYCGEGLPPGDDTGPVSPVPIPYGSVGELYRVIQDGFKKLAATIPLFIGPPGAQLTGMETSTNFPRPGALGGAWDVFIVPVTDLPSAIAALDEIRAQGEGRDEVGGDLTHYRTFIRILTELRQLKAEDPKFDPAHMVVSNPVLHKPTHSGQTQITNDLSAAVLDLFDAAYETMLLMLIRVLAHTDESAAEIAELHALMYGPMMTMIVRPLAEILVSLPAFADAQPERAGPSFQTYSMVQFLPHRQAAWKVLGERLQELADRCLSVSKMPGMKPRLAYVAESLRLISERFQADILQWSAQS